MRASGVQTWRWISVWLSLYALAECSPPRQQAPSEPTPYLKGFEPEGESFYQSVEYNNGAYGLYVNRTFKSAPGIVAPRLNFEKPFTACDDGSYIFVTPRGEKAQSTPYVLDASGSLVWTPASKYGQVYNLQVVHYRGDSYITFWAGNDSVGGHGAGKYHMFDKHYQPFRTLDAANGLQADLHSFTITPEDTVLCISYEKIDATKSNLQPYHRQSWIWDSLFQEFDLETGELTFQWRASDHFMLQESYSTRPYNATEDLAWDWFHMNMVEKDSQGNYLVTSRHLRCIFYVSGETGEVLWRLGGKNNQFDDLSPPHGTFFVGQHDAHWDEDQKFITLFDNRADWEYEHQHVSRGTRLEVDLDDMTVKVNTTFDHPQHIFAFSQGSYQTLPNGNVLIGYGYTAAFTEFSPNGTVLCDAYLEPSGRFSSGDVQSYRNLKFNWTGIPLTKPSLVLDDDDTLLVSWLGATEVRSWLLQDSIFPNEAFGAALTVPKTGFETKVVWTAHMPIQRYVRAVALDAHRRILATSLVVDLGESVTPSPALEDGAVDSVPATTITTTTTTTSISPADDYVEGFEYYDYDDAVQLQDDIAYLELLVSLTFVVIVAVLLIFWVSIGPRVFGSCARGASRGIRRGVLVASFGASSEVRWHIVDRRWWRDVEAVKRILLGSNEHLPSAVEEEDDDDDDPLGYADRYTRSRR